MTYNHHRSATFWNKTMRDKLKVRVFDKNMETPKNIVASSKYDKGGGLSSHTFLS